MPHGGAGRIGVPKLLEVPVSDTRPVRRRPMSAAVVLCVLGAAWVVAGIALLSAAWRDPVSYDDANVGLALNTPALTVGVLCWLAATVAWSAAAVVRSARRS